MSQSPFAAYSEGGKDEIVLTFPHNGKWFTVVTDKNPSGAPLVRESYTEPDAKAAHSERLADVNAGKLGEFDANEDDGA